jgi:hypothetical protein
MAKRTVEDALQSLPLSIKRVKHIKLKIDFERKKASQIYKQLHMTL